MTVTLVVAPAARAPFVMSPLKPAGKLMLLKVMVLSPLLVIISTSCEDEPMKMLPKFRSPLSEIIRVWTNPVPDAWTVFTPLKASEFTVTVPLKTVALVGAKVTVTLVVAPGAIAPEKAPLNPTGYVILLTFRVTLPVLVIVRVSCANEPTGTPPKFKSPLRAMALAMPVPEAAI